MTYSVDFKLSISHSQIMVFQSLLVSPFNDWTRKHFYQGFSWRPGSVSFGTLDEGGPHLVRLFVGAHDSDVAGARVIDVPFYVPPDGRIDVASIADRHEFVIPPGVYQLRFEAFFAASDVALPIITLRFRPHDEPVFAVVVADSDLNPGPELLLTAQPALGERLNGRSIRRATSPTSLPSIPSET